MKFETRAAWFSVGIFLSGFAMASVVAYLGYNKKLEAVKAQSALVAADAARKDSLAQALSDSVAKVTATLVAEKAAAKRKASVAETRANEADSALAAATPDAERVPILVRQVADLREANAGLKQALTLAEAQAAAESRRADILHDIVHDLSRQMVDLNGKIQRLHPPPTLAMKVLKVASYAGTFAAGVQAGRTILK